MDTRKSPEGPRTGGSCSEDDRNRSPRLPARRGVGVCGGGLGKGGCVGLGLGLCRSKGVCLLALPARQGPCLWLSSPTDAQTVNPSPNPAEVPVRGRYRRACVCFPRASAQQVEWRFLGGGRGGGGGGTRGHFGQVLGLASVVAGTHGYITPAALRSPEFREACNDMTLPAFYHPNDLHHEHFATRNLL